MKNAKWNSIDEFDDISTKDQYQIAREAGLSDREAMEACNRMSRDNARTPMQWTSGENAGFTKGTAWLKINPDYKEINVEDQENNPDSVLNYYRKLVAPVSYTHLDVYKRQGKISDDCKSSREVKWWTRRCSELWTGACDRKVF